MRKRKKKRKKRRKKQRRKKRRKERGRKRKKKEVKKLYCFRAPNILEFPLTMATISPHKPP